MDKNLLNESVIREDMKKSLKESVGLAITIESHSTGYSPDQCGNTMTVAELIDALSEYNDNTKVYLKLGNRGCIYGSIDVPDIGEYETED